ncbi:hypothetical protein OHA21_38775 [Actinoplanes sp. NBC_00393]|uniref:hypothetical protein n=1 Tax=Actinoplanes sp. NBC_00393 TaxID=2975953 RepID=UPI002E24BD5A
MPAAVAEQRTPRRGAHPTGVTARTATADHPVDLITAKASHIEYRAGDFRKSDQS